MIAPQALCAPLAPPLKWAGGKRWLIPQLLPHWQRHAHRRLVEPFVGGLAVTLGLQPDRALLGDVNPHLINFYRWLQRGLTITGEGIDLRNTRQAYLRNRARFNHLISTGEIETEEAARLWVTLNRSSFNGLARFNRSGFFNVPFGRYKTLNYRLSFEEYRTALAPYEFVLGDFAALRVRPSDFIYADPPYDVEFTTYSAGGFSWDDQVRLAQWLAKHRGPVIASNQATPRVLRLYRDLGFTVKKIAAPRRISCNGNRDDALEMLAFNAAALDG